MFDAAAGKSKSKMRLRCEPGCALKSGADARAVQNLSASKLAAVRMSQRIQSERGAAAACNALEKRLLTRIGPQQLR